MLTKSDLKEFRKIVREEVEAESENTRNELQAEMKMNMVRSVGELRELNNRVKNIEVKLNKIQKRVERIEKHLNLEPVSA